MTPFTDLPKKHFGLIFADPPWAFRTFGGADTTPSRTDVDPYPVMRLPDIKALPVAEVAKDDAILLLWTVSYLQDEATEVARAWGFEPKSVAFVEELPPEDLAFVWDKGRIGMGYWVRQEVEICKLYTRGKPKRLDAGVAQMIRQPRREHSRKPDEAYLRAERLAAGPYLEMFARQSRRGWTTWGNEATKFDLPQELLDLLASASPPPVHDEFEALLS